MEKRGELGELWRNMKRSGDSYKKAVINRGASRLSNG